MEFRWAVKCNGVVTNYLLSNDMKQNAKRNHLINMLPHRINLTCYDSIAISMNWSYDNNMVLFTI